jgi:translation initiation factor 3 subunit L
MALGRWPDAIKTFVSVLIFFVRMKPYHTRSYQYGSVSLSCFILEETKKLIPDHKTV